MAPYKIFQPAMTVIDNKIRQTMILTKSRIYGECIEKSQKLIRRKLTIIKARREMFFFKWDKLSFHIQALAAKKKDSKIQTFVENVLKVPMAVIDQIAKVYVKSCELVYDIAVLEFKIKAGREDLLPTLEKQRIRLKSVKEKSAKAAKKFSKG